MVITSDPTCLRVAKTVKDAIKILKLYVKDSQLCPKMGGSYLEGCQEYFRGRYGIH